MKKFLLPILIALVSFSCSNDDDADCALAIPEPPERLFIELVDTDGNNLIENETFDAEEIFIRFGNTVITGVVFTGVTEIENFIAIEVFGQDGNNTFEIVLDANETDTLILNLTEKGAEGPCGFTTFDLNTATYNGTAQTIQNFNDDFLISVTR